LEVARRLFGEKGHATSTREIAREAGISEAVLYQRFASKDALFFASMQPPGPDLDDLLAPDFTDRGARERLDEIAARMLGYFRVVIPSFLHLFTHPAFEPKTHLRALHDPPAHGLIGALAALLKGLVAEGHIGPADPAATAALIVAAVHSVAMFELFGEHRAIEPRAAVRPLLDALWSGLDPGRCEPSDPSKPSAKASRRGKKKGEAI
jgi:AcrR family transcriptional regulator